MQQRKDSKRDPGRRAKAGSADARAAKPADLDAIFAANGPALLLKAIEMAYGGNTSALRLCLQEALARDQKRSSEFQLPATLTTLDGIAKNSEAVIVAHCAGKLSFERAARIQTLLALHQKFLRGTTAESSEQERSLAASTGSIEDFLEPLRATEKVTGYKIKMLDRIETGHAAASEE